MLASACAALGASTPEGIRTAARLNRALSSLADSYGDLVMAAMAPYSTAGAPPDALHELSGILWRATIQRLHTAAVGHRDPAGGEPAGFRSGLLADLTGRAAAWSPHSSGPA